MSVPAKVEAGAAVERYEPHPLERLTVEQVRFIANTEIVPKALRGNPAAILAVILKGRALGLDDIHAMSAIHFIEGKPSISAETMMMLARRAGHSITVKADVDSATAKGKRADNGDTYEVTWTMEDAGRAGLTNKDNWKRHPRQMLSWRATSELCRVLFPDVLAGTGHTPDELERTPEEVAADALRVSPRADGAPDDVIDVESIPKDSEPTIPLSGGSAPAEGRPNTTVEASTVGSEPEPIAEPEPSPPDGPAPVGDEPEPVDWEALGLTKVPKAYADAAKEKIARGGQTLAEVAASAPEWVEWALRPAQTKRLPADFVAALELWATRPA